MLSFRTVRVATAAVRRALAYSVTGDRLGGVVGLGHVSQPNIHFAASPAWLETNRIESDQQVLVAEVRPREPTSDR
jgi:hypothetical protein